MNTLDVMGLKLSIMNAAENYADAAVNVERHSRLPLKDKLVRKAIRDQQDAFKLLLTQVGTLDQFRDKE